MRKKTKFFILFMGVLLALGLSACGKKTLEDVIVGRWQSKDEYLILSIVLGVFGF